MLNGQVSIRGQLLINEGEGTPGTLYITEYPVLYRNEINGVCCNTPVDCVSSMVMMVMMVVVAMFCRATSFVQSILQGFISLEHVADRFGDMGGDC